MFLEVVKKRRSIRKFKENKVTISKIHQIIESGIWAPTSGNTMPFKFLILDNKKIINDFFSITLDTVVKWKRNEALKKGIGFKELQKRYEEYFDKLKKAPIMILVFFDLEVGASVFTNGNIDEFKSNGYLYNSLRDSLFLCVENMLLTATVLDLGALYFELPRAAGTPVNELFNLRETLEFFISIPVGYPDENPIPKERNFKDFLLELKLEE